jgi:arylsulfate sulfotransferase
LGKQFTARPRISTIQVMAHMQRALPVLVTFGLLGWLLAGCLLAYPETPIDPAGVRTIVNPYGSAPLVALVVVSAAEGIAEKSVTRVDVSLTSADGRATTWTLPYGTPRYMTNFDTSDLPGIDVDDLVIPVLGLRPDKETTVDVRICDDAARRVRTYSTTVTAALATDTGDQLRDGYPVISVSADRALAMEPGMTLVSFSMGDNGRFVTRPFIIDSTGAMRWVLKLDDLVNWASPVERMKNGNLLLGRGGFVYEYSMLGRRVRAWNIERFGYTQHHDIFEIRNGPHRGNLIVAVDRIGADTVEDFVIELDRAGNLVDTWDLRDVLDTSRDNLLRNASDWLHVNAVLYDSRDDCIIISGRNQGVAKVDRKHMLRWILAPHAGWGAAGVSDDGPDTAAFLLTAVSDAGRPWSDEVQQGLKNVEGGRVFDWPWGQHSIKLLANGNLFMFDNGFNRHFLSARAGVSRAVEYRLDESARRVRQVWEYGVDRGADYYSDIISDVDLLPRTRNRLVTSGSIRNSPGGPHSYVTEVTYPRAKVVFEARIGFKDAHSNLKAGGWGNIDIVYRAERLLLYPGVEGRDE